MQAKLILASASPRRRELLALTGIEFIIDAPEVDERCALPAREAVMEICRRKAVAAARKHPGEVVLAADTLVLTALGEYPWSSSCSRHWRRVPRPMRPPGRAAYSSSSFFR